jgi:hypothetical protein
VSYKSIHHFHHDSDCRCRICCRRNRMSFGEAVGSLLFLGLLGAAVSHIGFSEPPRRIERDHGDKQIEE